MKSNPDERLVDRIDKAIIPNLQGGPHNNTIAALAVCFKEAATEEFRQYAVQIVKNAKALAKELIDRGFNLITGGTDNHLILIDVVKSCGIPGKSYAQALYKAGLETNFNSVPNDPRKPFSPSGLRIGTPSVTTRGFKEAEMVHIADWMDRVAKLGVKQPKAWSFDETALAAIRNEVKDLCTSGAFPVPGIDF